MPSHADATPKSDTAVGFLGVLESMLSHADVADATPRAPPRPPTPAAAHDDPSRPLGTSPTSLKLLLLPKLLPSPTLRTDGYRQLLPSPVDLCEVAYAVRMPRSRSLAPAGGSQFAQNTFLCSSCKWYRM